MTLHHSDLAQPVESTAYHFHHAPQGFSEPCSDCGGALDLHGRGFLPCAGYIAVHRDTDKPICRKCLEQKDRDACIAFLKLRIPHDAKENALFDQEWVRRKTAREAAVSAIGAAQKARDGHEVIVDGKRVTVGDAPLLQQSIAEAVRVARPLLLARYRLVQLQGRYLEALHAEEDAYARALNSPSHASQRGATRAHRQINGDAPSEAPRSELERVLRAHEEQMRARSKATRLDQDAAAADGDYLHAARLVIEAQVTDAARVVKETEARLRAELEASLQAELAAELASDEAAAEAAAEAAGDKVLEAEIQGDGEKTPTAPAAA